MSTILNSLFVYFSEDAEAFVKGHRNCRTYLVNHVLTDLTKSKWTDDFCYAMTVIFSSWMHQGASFSSGSVSDQVILHSAISDSYWMWLVRRQVLFPGK